MKFGVEIEFVLHEAGEVRTQDAGFVGRSARAVVANGRVFAERNTNPHNLTTT